jgi:hypothetical protein
MCVGGTNDEYTVYMSPLSIPMYIWEDNIKVMCFEEKWIEIATGRVQSHDLS